jgi:hypothetical protein
MIPSRGLDLRPKPGAVEKAMHWAALIGAFVLLGSIVIFADIRPSARNAALKPVAIEANR